MEGQNASKQALKLIEAIPNKLKSTIIKAQYINNRRWDVKLKNGIKLKLSENKMSESFENYYKIIKSMPEKDFQEIELIDLRIPKKGILKFKDSKND